MRIFTILLTFLVCLIFIFFILDICKRNMRSYVMQKWKSTCRKKHVLTLLDYSIKLKQSGSHMTLSRLVTLSVSSLHNLDI